MSRTIIKKATIKTVGINAKELLQQNRDAQIAAGATAETVKDYRAVVALFCGTVNRIEDKIHAEFGRAAKFLGNFGVRNLITNDDFVSGQMYLPDIAADILEGAFNANNKESVNFVFRIGISQDKASSVGYVFFCEPVGKMESPLDHLLNQANPNPATAPVAAPVADNAAKPKKAAK